MSFPPPDFAPAAGVHPLVATILWRRGYDTPESARAFMDPAEYCPAPASDLPGMADAVGRLRQAITRGELVRVWGDFDADGQTATSVLVLGLRALGANVDYTIPDRATGHRGLNRDGIARAAEDGVRVLLTCDCGATDFDEIAFARQLGLDVVVSDHHDLAHPLPPAEANSSPVADARGARQLPDAAAVVNPKRLSPDHPLADLPGVGVAYKVIEGLTVGMRAEQAAGHAAVDFQPGTLLDLVAVGIVADVARLRGDTRHLLQRGLRQLRTKPRPGVRALIRATEIEPANLDADDIGYQIGPRLNAVGRLAQAEWCVELLTTSDVMRAHELAGRIEVLNEQRKALQRRVEHSAFEQIANDPSLLSQPVIVLTSADWDDSIIGVVASTVSNRHRKPAILIAVQPGQNGRGSARSANGIDIHAAIAAHGHLIGACGGHPQAAGFAIHSDQVVAFRDGINAYVSRLGPADRSVSADTPVDAADAVVAWRDVTLDLCEQLERLAPFGCGNPRPVLKSERVRVVRAEPLGRDGNHLALYISDGEDHVTRALWWRSTTPPAANALCDLWFTLHRRFYRGRVSLQVHVVRLQPVRDAVEAG